MTSRPGSWSEAFELVPSIEVAYIWHACGPGEVLDGLLRIGFLYRPT